MGCFAQHDKEADCLGSAKIWRLCFPRLRTPHWKPAAVSSRWRPFGWSAPRSLAGVLRPPHATVPVAPVWPKVCGDTRSPPKGPHPRPTHATQGPTARRACRSDPASWPRLRLGLKMRWSPYAPRLSMVCKRIAQIASGAVHAAPRCSKIAPVRGIPAPTPQFVVLLGVRPAPHGIFNRPIAYTQRAALHAQRRENFLAFKVAQSLTADALDNRGRQQDALLW